ncbi:non-hydrolyzing UDP-N-acetylglucosamine 2-epimerase [Aeromonas veronii]|uniref:non-hydrolyzing UDP-N-acetylglucosamine 2-epimerase n=1 Tax=Aeromonas veronii TaxID=654 RepID=UPI003B9F9342
MKKKIMLIFGTRPEAIKMCPLVNELKKSDLLEVKVCVTAQHREMLDKVLDIFNVVPDYDLNIMAHGQTIIDINNKVLSGVDEIIKNENPDLLLVHGDTSTTLSAGMAAFYNKVKVGHVEAGLRSGNIYSPYPEEFNRKLVSHFTHFHFAPTEGNKKNLLDEGIAEGSIFVTGNTVIDALKSVENDDYIFENDLLNKIDYNSSKVILITAHRRENLGLPMVNIFNAIKEILEEHENVIAIFPMHRNPLVRNIANEILGDVSNAILIEPLDYVPFANLMARSYLIATDSGGIQEEAPALGKPVIVLRTETERPEAVSAGTVKVSGVDKSKIKEDIIHLLECKDAYERMSQAVNPYGVGNACKQIREVLENHG